MIDSRHRERGNPVTHRILRALPVAAGAVLLLGACAGEPEATPEPTITETVVPAPTEAPPTELVFTQPTDCTEVLPASRQQELEAAGRILLGGPGGKYPDYFPAATPEEQSGGISCVWGDEDDPASTVTISVAPLSAATRGSVVEQLLGQGLNEAVIEGGISYAQIGDETSAPAVLNILRDDSWISVIAAAGGEAVFTEAVQLADEAAVEAYGAG